MHITANQTHQSSQFEKRSLYLALTLSLTAHLIFISLALKSIKNKNDHNLTAIIKNSVIEVDFTPKLKQQIVTPSEIGSEIEKPNSFLSDTTRSVKQEQLKRGQEFSSSTVSKRATSATPASSEAKPAKRSASVPNQSKPTDQNQADIKQSASNPSTIKQLLLDQSTVSQRFSQANQAPQQQIEESSESRYEPFSRAAGSGALFLGQSGSSDYLPSLPDGDLTMLNTKASHFAVFVRRVATRVFGEMRAQGWESISRQDLASISDNVEAEAIMSLSGQLISAKITQTSGSERFDRLLLMSIKAGLPDQNPPAAAVYADNQIHFIFQSRSWSKLVGSRNGGMSERRWLLLGSGLR